MTNTPIGKVLRVYRASQDIAQHDLARMIGINPSTLCRIEDGKSGDQATTTKIISWLFSSEPIAKKKGIKVPS